MVALTQHLPLDSELTFRDTFQALLTVRIVVLALIQQDDQPIAYHLTLQVDSRLYSQIDTKASFNLSPDLRHPTSPIEFLPEPDIAIKVTLKPDLLPSLSENSHTPEAAIAYLLHISHET